MSLIASRCVRWMSIAALAAAAWIGTGRVAFAQAATITWRAVINRANNPPVAFGPFVDTTVVPSQFVTSAVNVTDGVATLTATLIGQEIPFIAPLHGRQLIVTAATASVPPGYMNPLGTGFPTIDLYACYDFPLAAVGPPHIFGARLDGFLTNIAGLANDIDFASVGYWPTDMACMTPPPPGGPPILGPFSTVSTAPAVGFNTGIVFLGAFNQQTARLGTYHRFVVRNDGDAITLPGSAEAFVQDPGAKGPSPALNEWGLLGLALGILMLGSFILALRARPA